MGLFGTNKKEEKKKEEIPQVPTLPKLPEFQGFGEFGYDGTSQIHKLPSFPSNSLGMKFSQNTIKEAIAGEERGDLSDEDADEFTDQDDMRMMQEPLRRPMTEEFGSRFPSSSNFPRGSAPGPVFIRVDKFEGAMEVFNETRRKISEIEKVLDEIKRTKEKEDKELQSWEVEVKLMKDQIEKVDRDIFSKV
ncbi:MAG: hypothetical protein AABX91_02620 [Nanoarchaeota archaeon]